MSEGLELVELEPCPHCGFQNDSTAETCGKCGTRFAEYDPDDHVAPGESDAMEAAGGSSASSTPPPTSGSAGTIAGAVCGLINLLAVGYFSAIYMTAMLEGGVEPSWVSMPALLWAGVFLCLSMLVSMWMVYEKAGQRGWYVLIPIYNTVVMCRMAGKSGWWVLLLMIPLVNWIINLLLMVGLADHFGKGIGFGLGLFVFPFFFFPLLAFGEAQHVSQRVRRY